MSEVVDHHHHQSTSHKSIFVERSFWLRVVGHMKSESLAVFAFIQYLGGVLAAVLLGASLFFLEFKLVKEVITYVIVIPVLIFLAVKYLTLIPTVFALSFMLIQPKYAAIALSLISVFSFVWVLMV